jgi:hypothetical protein
VPALCLIIRLSKIIFPEGNPRRFWKRSFVHFMPPSLEAKDRYRGELLSLQPW